MWRNLQSSGAGKPVKMPWTGARARLALLAAAGLLTLAGCNSNRANNRAPDPLFGAAPGPTATRPTGNAAAAPVPSGAVSNAALVNGPSGPPPGYNPVGTPAGWQPGVAPPQPGPYQPYPQPQPGYPGQPNYPQPQPGYPPTQPYPSAQPIQPAYPSGVQPGYPPGQPIQPGYPPGPPSQPGYPPAQPVQPAYPPPHAANLTSLTPSFMPNTGRIASYDQALGYLGSLGVKWQRLESGQDGEWKFACSIPRRENPAISRTYEGRAPTYLAAVQTVLDQIHQDRP